MRIASSSKAATAALPNAIAQVIPDQMKWSLDEPPPPMYYKPIQEMAQIRARDRSSPPVTYELFQDIPGTMDSLVKQNKSDSQNTQEQGHFGRIALSILLLGHDYVDECHDLVLALSWPSDLEMTYGQSEYRQATPRVRACASYVHCMIHRKEAFHIGEFGMVGFDNAKFWSDQVTQAGSDGEAQLPQAQLVQAVQQLAQEIMARDDDDDEVGRRTIQEWSHRIVNQNKANPCMNHKAVHDMAMTVLSANVRKKNSGNTNQKNQNGKTATSLLQDFAEQVIEAELRILLLYSLQHAGFQVYQEDFPQQSQ